jgi:hypothetical protein
MKKKTKFVRKAKAKPSRALVVRNSKPPETPPAVDEAMRLIVETNAMTRETLERARARDEADACKIPAIESPKTPFDMAAMLADTLSAAEAAYIVHYSEQNIYHNIEHVGFEIITGKFFSNAKLREYWPDRYDEERFWEIARRPINRRRLASILQRLDEQAVKSDQPPNAQAMLPESQIM